MGRDRLLIIAAFFCTYVIWGSTYLANYWAIESLPPFGMSGTRFLTAGALMYGYSRWRDAHRGADAGAGGVLDAGMGVRDVETQNFASLHPGMTAAREWRNTAIIGILFLSIGTGAVVWAQQWIPTSTAALIIAFEPLLVMFMMWGALGNRPPLKAFFGAAISICGMALLIGQPESIGGTGPGAFYGLCAIAIGMTCWGSGMLLRQRLEFSDDQIRTTGMMMLSGGACLLLFSLVQNEWAGWSFAQLTSKTIGAWFFLVFFGSILAFTAFNYLLARVSAEKVATNTYVNPVVAVLLGALLNNETVTGQSILAGVVLLTGVYFINSAKKEPTEVVGEVENDPVAEPV